MSKQNLATVYLNSAFSAPERVTRDGLVHSSRRMQATTTLVICAVTRYVSFSHHASFHTDGVLQSQW